MTWFTRTMTEYQELAEALDVTGNSVAYYIKQLFASTRRRAEDQVDRAMH